MMNQNKEYEDMPVKEKKKKQELREAGMDVNGEFSMDSLKKWFRRAGGALSICAAAVCLMAVLMMGKNRKESLIMEVNSDIMMEFTMNRRGSVLSAKGMMARSNEAVSMTVFEGKSLGIAVGKIFDRLADNNSLGEDGGILISVRKSGAEVKASPEKIVKELQKQTESELQKKESRATVYVFESEEDTKTREIADKYGITVTKAEFLKHLFSENPGITIGKQEELAGYSSKRLIREINEQEYQISLKPVVVKTTFEKASEETTEETAALETTEAVSEQKSGALDTGEERESTKNDGLSEMQRRRKALEAGESVDWVDQETNRELGDPDEKDRHSSNSRTSPTETVPQKTAEPKTTEPKTEEPKTEEPKTEEPKTEEPETAEPGTTASETVPPETAPPTAPETAPPTAPETTAAVTETTAASGMLTPETKTPAYLRGPGFEDPDNPKNQN